VPGAAGQNAYTQTTQNFVIPAVGGSVSAAVQSSAALAVGMIVVVSGGGIHGTFLITSSTTGALQLQFLGLSYDSLSGQTIPYPATVTPTGTPGANSFTNSTGGTVVSTPSQSCNIAVAYSGWAGVGQVIFASDGTNKGTFLVTAVTFGTITGTFLGVTGDSTPTFTIATAAIVTPAANPNAAYPVSVANGGTGAATASNARGNLGAAAAGANADITSLTALSTPIPITEGGTGNITALAALAALINPSKTGTFVCNGATPVVVANTNVTANSVVIVCLKTVGGTVGAVPAVKTITVSTGFTIAGTASDTSTYNYIIIN
jgi:hypothetical protein